MGGRSNGAGFDAALMSPGPSGARRTDWGRLAASRTDEAASVDEAAEDSAAGCAAGAAEMDAFPARRSQFWARIEHM
jgi:hypothetical protein